jgi:hypothetical protein
MPDDPRLPPLPCPGCGAVLPGSAGLRDPRSLASWACHAAYGEVAGYESQHLLELGRWHQLLVDTYSAQHVGERTPPMSVAFALLGLQLTLEEGRSGLDVREIHQRLAATRTAWPRLEIPARRGDLTVVDVRRAASPDDHVARLRAWSSSVWEAWAPVRPALAALRANVAPAMERGR